MKDLAANYFIGGRGLRGYTSIVMIRELMQRVVSMSVFWIGLKDSGNENSKYSSLAIILTTW